MDTAQQLRDALIECREEKGGITLELMARIIKGILDEAEVRALINELQITK